MFPLGSKFRFAVAVLNLKKFIKLHNKAAANLANVDDLNGDWTFTYPAQPSTYPEMGAMTGDINIKKMETHWNQR